MADDVVLLITAPNEPIGRMWEQMLLDEEIPVLVRPAGPGMGGWGSVATFEHDLYVRPGDLARARQIMDEEAGEAWLDE